MRNLLLVMSTFLLTASRSFAADGGDSADPRMTMAPRIIGGMGNPFSGLSTYPGSSVDLAAPQFQAPRAQIELPAFNPAGASVGSPTYLGASVGLAAPAFNPAGASVGSPTYLGASVGLAAPAFNPAGASVGSPTYLGASVAEADQPASFSKSGAISSSVDTTHGGVIEPAFYPYPAGAGVDSVTYQTYGQRAQMAMGASVDKSGASAHLFGSAAPTPLFGQVAPALPADPLVAQVGALTNALSQLIGTFAHLISANAGAGAQGSGGKSGFGGYNDYETYLQARLSAATRLTYNREQYSKAIKNVLTGELVAGRITPVQFQSLYSQQTYY